MDREINSVADLLQIPKPDLHAHVRWLWRGQADIDWQLKPGVYRSAFPTSNEPSRLLLERHLAQDFRIESAGLIGPKKDDADLYFLQQHYGIPTRLLDWCHSALTALFFAAIDNKTQDSVNTDGPLFVMDGYKLSVTQKVSKAEYQGVVTSRHPLFVESMVRIYGWKMNPIFLLFSWLSDPTS